LTRRAKHWQNGIIENLEHPRGEIRRGFFHAGEGNAMVKQPSSPAAVIKAGLPADSELDLER